MQKQVYGKATAVSVVKTLILRSGYDDFGLIKSDKIYQQTVSRKR